MDNRETESQSVTIAPEKIREEEINPLDYLRVILKYHRMILLICGVAVVATAVTSLRSPKIYSATTSIVPPLEILQRERGGLGGGLGAMGSSLVSRVINVQSVADMYVGILQSRAVIDSIVDKFDLLKVYNVEKRWITRDILQDNTTIKTSRESIVRITVRDKDPNRAAAIANSYVEELDRRNKRLSAGQATSKREFIEKRLKEINEELSNIDDIPARKAKVLDTLYETLSVEYELAKIEQAKSMPTIQILDTAIVPETRMPRGTKKKTALAGAVSLMLGIFVAFAREYFAKIKENESEKQGRYPSKARQESVNAATFSDLESKRKIVGTRRKKLSQESKSYY